MRREAPIMSVSWYLSERYATYGEGRGLPALVSAPIPSLRPHLGEPRLDDELGALVAREEGDVDPHALERGGVLVHDGIHLRVAHVRVLCVERARPHPRPRQLVVAAADPMSLCLLVPPGEWGANWRIC